MQERIIRSGILSVIIIQLLFISGCSKDYDYPDEPVLQFREFRFVQNPEGIVTSGILVLEFTDGDGDIGLGQEDTLPPFEYGSEYYYNFIIDLYTKQEGQYVPVVFPDTTFTFNSRIPRIVLSGNSKAIKGDLEYTFDLLIMKPFLPSDTIMMKTYITDRSLNKSNIVQTPDIKLI